MVLREIYCYLSDAMKDNNLTAKVAQSLVFLFGLWDLYSFELGIRPLDFVGFFLTLFLVYQSAKNRGLKFSKREVLVLFGFVGWAVIYGFFGLNNSEVNLKLVIGFFGGVILFLSIYFISIPKEILLKPIDLFISANIFVVIVQTVLHYSVNILFHPFIFFGLEPRSLGEIFRPCGLALEPASYSLTTLMLLSIRRTSGWDKDTLFWCAIISVLLTFSFWGVIASILFSSIIVFRSRLEKSYLAFTLVFGLLIVLPKDAIPEDINNWIRNRVENIADDNSAMDRYTVLLSQNLSFSIMDICFGYGISNDYHRFGSNGGAFLFNAGGIFGCILFSMLIFSLQRVKLEMSKVFIVVLFLTAAPLWNTLIWWFWLAIFLTINKPINKVNPK